MKLLTDALLAASLAATASAGEQPQPPSILWIVTDDQRADSVSAFNRAVSGSDDSPLGHVESPNIARLAAAQAALSQDA